MTADVEVVALQAVEAMALAIIVASPDPLSIGLQSREEFAVFIGPLEPAILALIVGSNTNQILRWW
jgi:hypothetical protein